MTHFSPTSPTVSVLMPIHDAQGTLNRAIESVQNQTMRNVEIIAVDAGSEDATARMLDTAMERDIRIVTQHMKPCTREEALNIALEQARGEYVMVMDAEGWVESTYLQHMVDLAEEHGLDLVVGALDVEAGGERNGFRLTASSEDAEYLTQHEFRSHAWQYFLSGQLAPASGKLFLRSRIDQEGISFDAEAGNDHSFTMAYLRDVERVAFTGQVYRVVRGYDGGSQDGEAATELFGGVEAAYDSMLDLLKYWGLAGDAASVEALASRYLEMLAVCVEAAAAAPETTGGGRELVGRMISGERARLAADVASPRDTAAKALVGPIKTQNALMATMQAKLLGMLRRGVPATLTPDILL